MALFAKISDKERLESLQQKADIAKMKAEIARKELSCLEQIEESRAVQKRLSKARFNGSVVGKTVNVFGKGFKELGKTLKDNAKKHKAKNKKTGKKPRNIFAEAPHKNNSETSFLDKAFGG